MNLITVDEYKSHLRKKYPWNKCPKKSDRVHIPEEIWAQIDWTPEEIERNICLPHKMWNMRHDDHLWPFCHQWRGDDAIGSLAPVGHPKHKPTPPKLVSGRGVARWMSDSDASILEIPQLADYHTTWTPDNFPKIVEAIERKGGHAREGERYEISKEELFAKYGPSPLQKFSDKSLLVVDPKHVSGHRMIKRREMLGESKTVTGADTVAFFRYGWRWDSGDNYYVEGAHYVGLAWN